MSLVRSPGRFFKDIQRKKQILFGKAQTAPFRLKKSAQSGVLVVWKKCNIYVKSKTDSNPYLNLNWVVEKDVECVAGAVAVEVGRVGSHHPHALLQLNPSKDKQ